MKRMNGITAALAALLLAPVAAFAAPKAVVPTAVIEGVTLPDGTTATVNLFAKAKDAQTWVSQNTEGGWANKWRFENDEWKQKEVDIDGYFQKIYTADDMGSLAATMKEKKCATAVAIVQTDTMLRRIEIVADKPYAKFTLARKDFVTQAEKDRLDFARGIIRAGSEFDPFRGTLWKGDAYAKINDSDTKESVQLRFKDDGTVTVHLKVRTYTVEKSGTGYAARFSEGLAAYTFAVPANSTTGEVEYPLPGTDVIYKGTLTKQ